MRKPPNAPMAEIQPSAAAVSRLAARTSAAAPPASAWKIAGIDRYVEPLATPLMRNSTMKEAKNSGNEPVSTPAIAPTTPAPMTQNDRLVMGAPARLSASHPPRGRASEPTSGPRAAIHSESNAGNSILMTSGNAKE